jgi:alpha-aminoadipate carrier protein LysW
MSTNCPECAADIEFAAGTEENEIIVCPDCGVDLEVTSLDPAEVELAPMEAEDWGE